MNIAIGALIGFLLAVIFYLTFIRKSKYNDLPKLDTSYKKEVDKIESIRKEKEDEIKKMALDDRVKLGNSIISRRRRRHKKN